MFPLCSVFHLFVIYSFFPMFLVHSVFPMFLLYRLVLGSRFKVALTNATNMHDKFWHQARGEILASAKHENRECCPQAQHGALSAVSAGLAFSAVTIAVSEPFLLPAAENWSPVTR
jgi:hypothetical protein